AGAHAAGEARPTLLEAGEQRTHLGVHEADAANEVGLQSIGHRVQLTVERQRVRRQVGEPTAVRQLELVAWQVLVVRLGRDVRIQPISGAGVEPEAVLGGDRPADALRGRGQGALGAVDVEGAGRVDHANARVRTGARVLRLVRRTSAAG